MRTKQNWFLCLASLFNGAALALFGHESTVPHAHFTQASISYTIALVDQDLKPLTATWTSDRSGIYKLVIDRPAGAVVKPISLYNLGLQGRLWAVAITTAASTNADNSAATVVVKRPNGDVVTVALPWQIPPTNDPPAGGQRWDTVPATDTGVWFIDFSGVKCELTVLVSGGHPTHGKPLRMPGSTATISGHDGFPDPPSSGSES